MQNSEMMEMQAIVKGHVQGVFFRATVKEHAETLGLHGYAKNLMGGSVEIRAQGTKNELETFLKAIRKDPGSATIESISTKYEKPQKIYVDFTTR